MFSSANGEHAGLRRHDHPVVLGDEVARRPQPVAVERGADLAPVGEGHGGRAVPRLHQAGVILVEGAALAIHQRVAGPGLGDQHHGRVRQAVAAHHQELERVVEAGGIRLALVGDRPQLGDVAAEQRRRHRRLPRRHPVDVAAQRVDLAVVGDHAVGMRQLPRRERVGGEALVHQRHRRGEARVGEVRVVGLHLVGQEHALVDQRAARQRHRVVADVLALVGEVERVGDDLADEIEAALELLLVLHRLRPADEELPVHRLHRLHHLGQAAVVDRHRAPAEELQALLADDAHPHALAVRAQTLVLRHEEMADGIVAGLGQLDAERPALLAQELVRDLDEDAGAVAGDRVGADGTAVLEVLEDGERVLDQLVRFLALEVGDEADAARVVLAARIEEPARARTSWRGIRLPRARCRIRFERHGPAFRLACVPPEGSGRAHLGPSRTARQSAAETSPMSRGAERRRSMALPRLQLPAAPPNLPDRTRGLRCSIRRGGTLRPITPELRGLARHRLDRSVSRRCAAPRWPSQVKDSIADLISSAKVNCAVRQAFRLYLPAGGILETPPAATSIQVVQSMTVETPSPSFAAAVARLHAAMAKVANGDTSGIRALYAHSDDATSFYGWGGYEKGWDAVSRRWDWAGAQFKGGTVSYQTDHHRHGRARLHHRHRDLQGAHGRHGSADAVVEPRDAHLPPRRRRMAPPAPPRQPAGRAIRAVGAAA